MPKVTTHYVCTKRGLQFLVGVSFFIGWISGLLAGLVW